jgi:TolA-binding protein
LQTGLCRLEQKKFGEAAQALLAVPVTYGYAEIAAESLYNAAGAYVEMKQVPEAVRLLQRVAKDYPDSRWAEAARRRLDSLKQGSAP